MAVKVGSAKLNEKGTTTGGAYGDQTGGEVATQNWYLHSKGWVVIRAKSAAMREKIARNMQAACDNNNIGYCQTHRGTLTTAAKPYGYDAARVTKKVEVDCSELVRVCLLYAGITVNTFTTATERSMLQATGAFEVFTTAKYCKSSDYLRRGDILVTKTKGHTVVVLSDGAKVGASSESSTGSAAQKGEDYDMDTIRKGSRGKAVKIWQIIVGSNPDGIFGADTEMKTRTFQKARSLSVDGIVGPKSWKAGLESV